MFYYVMLCHRYTLGFHTCHTCLLCIPEDSDKCIRHIGLPGKSWQSSAEVTDKHRAYKVPGLGLRSTQWHTPHSLDPLCSLGSSTEKSFLNNHSCQS